MNAFYNTYGGKFHILMWQVWDNNIIETEEERFYDSSADEIIAALNKNITVPSSLLPT